LSSLPTSLTSRFVSKAIIFVFNTGWKRRTTKRKQTANHLKEMLIDCQAFFRLAERLLPGKNIGRCF
jgi:hypothetical protein